MNKLNVVISQRNPKVAIFTAPDATFTAISWDYVLEQLENELGPICGMMDSCNDHLEAIAVRLEEMGSSSNTDNEVEGE